MRVAILTLNEYADVQHILNIAIGLKERGHSVSMCAGAFLKPVCTEYGIKHTNTPVDITEITNDLRDNGEFQYMNRKKIDLLAYTRKHMKNKYKNQLNQFFIMAQDAHVILYDTNAIGATDVAEYLGIPAVHIANMPNIYPVSNYPKDDWANKSIINKPFNKLTYKSVSKIEKPLIDVINKFRYDLLKIKKRKVGQNFYKLHNWNIPIILPYAPEYFSEIKGFNDNIHITGFNSIQKNKKLDKDMYKFFNSGSKPIIINFGLVPYEEPETLIERLYNAIDETGCRYIFVVGNSNIDLPNTKDIHLTKDSRVRDLYPRCKGIIHAGEMLYTSDALYYGIPQLIVPTTVQQRFWADYLYQKRYILKPMLEEELTTKKIIKVIKEFDDENVIKRSEELKEVFHRTEGTEKSIKVIEDAVKNWIDTFHKGK